MQGLFVVACAVLGVVPAPNPGGLQHTAASTGPNERMYHQSLAADGQTIHASGGRGGHFIFDVSGQQPALLTTIAGGTYIHHLHGTTLFISVWDTIVIYDVSTPATPVRVGTITGTFCPDMAVHSGYLYALHTLRGTLSVYSLSNLASPQKLWEEKLPQAAGTVSVLSIISGTHAYVGNHGVQKLVIFDLSTPTAPVRLPYNSFTGPGVTQIRIVRFTQAGSLVYFAYGGGGLKVVDVTNPAVPVVVGTWFRNPSWVTDSEVKGNRLYVSAGSTGRGLHVLDITDPTAPFEIDAYNHPTTSWGVTVRGDSVFLGWYHMHRFDPATPPCQTGVKVDGADAAEVPLPGQGPLAVTLSGVAWTGFQPWMAGAGAFELPSPLPAMSAVELRCCGGEECEFFFALFRCEACTGPRPAGLAQTLVLDGWEAGSCGPQFGDGFRSTVFRKRVDATAGDVVLSYTAMHNEIAAVFKLPGGNTAGQAWCSRPHGPVVSGPGCGARCPTI